MHYLSDRAAPPSSVPDRALMPRPAARLLLHLFALTLPAAAGVAQGPVQRLSAADTALVGRILLAEDARDSSAVALAEGARHADARVRELALRARGRISDPKFVQRTALAPLPPPVAWDEPAWRLRLRALTSVREDCAALARALGDDSWPVRMRATSLLREPCAGDTSVVATLRGWVDRATSPPAAAVTLPWQGSAQGLLALARLHRADARPRVRRLSTHATWGLRQYAARAAGIVADTATLRTLARDADDNVAEAAIEQLSRLVGHAEDATYLAALAGRGAQTVRVAAIALKGSPRADVAPAARAAFERLVARDNASARDARLALLDAAGLPPEADRPPTTRLTLSRVELAEAAALALGREVRVRVAMDAASGGGSFVVRLRGDAAPIMGARLLALVRRGYYDGLTWHRVEHDFVIQGGSPGANEYVGWERYLRDELGGVSHARGTLGMSTRGHDTGDAQWFVNLRDNRRLDADYTVWGEVVEGMEVVDGILEGARIARIAVEAPGRE